MTGPRHRFPDHVGELAVELWAPDFASLCAEAGRAFAEIIAGEGRVVRPSLPPRQLDVRGRDRELLLVNWLNELVYLADQEHAVYPDVRVLSADDSHLRAELRGQRLDVPRVAVKAATFHGLCVTPSEGGLAATVILDV